MELLVIVAGSVLALLALLVARTRTSWGRRMFLLDDKVVVITGAANGIGRRLAHKVFFETRSVTLVLLDIDAKGLEGLQTELLLQSKQRHHHLNQSVFVYECNVADYR